MKQVMLQLDTGEHPSPFDAIVALDAGTGQKLWTAHTMEDAKYTGKVSSTGVKQRGPSGAPIWSTPAIDAMRGLVYAGTGQATSLPATNTSDAVLAIDLASGELKWSFQALARDVWHLGCQFNPAKSGPNCPSAADSVKGPWATREPKGVFDAYSSLRWNCTMSPVSPAQVTRCAAATVIPVLSTRSPCARSSQ